MRGCRLLAAHTRVFAFSGATNKPPRPRASSASPSIQDQIFAARGPTRPYACNSLALVFLRCTTRSNGLLQTPAHQKLTVIVAGAVV